MRAPRYTVGTIWEMAEIPEEAMGRFLAELPEIIRGVRYVKQMHAETGLDALVRMGAPEWIDDDKGTATASYSVEGSDNPLISLDLKPLMGDAARSLSPDRGNGE